MLELGVRIMMPTRTTAAFGLWSSVAQQYWEILEPTVQQIIFCAGLNAQFSGRERQRPEHCFLTDKEHCDKIEHDSVP
jgi:hypothetical protein